MLYVWLPVTPAGCQVTPKSCKTQHTTPHTATQCLVGFLPMDNSHNCKLHLFGCWNSLVLNLNDHETGIILWLRVMVRNELAYYTICDDGTDGGHICFAA